MKVLAMFEEPIDVLTDIRRERIRKDAPKSERPMSEFTSALEPSNEATFRQRFADTFNQSVDAGKETADELAIIEFRLDLTIRKLWPERRVCKTHLRGWPRLSP